MPELPEVETIVRELNRKISGKTLSRFFVFDKKLPRAGFRLPAKIVAAQRHGKYIVFHAEGDPVKSRGAGVSQDHGASKKILIHLRMTGSLLLDTNKKKRRWSAAKGERAAFLFSDGFILHFFDTRRFGTVEWFGSAHHKWPKKENLPELGMEPLSKEFTLVALKEMLRDSSRAIKSFLLDQKKVAGIGNIYADESLWTARINPKRRAGSLSGGEIKKLAESIKKTLREAIKKGGFTLRDYKRLDGSSGYYQHSRKVYDREGLPCKRCHATIRRIKIGGRSSYFCFVCQPPPRI